MHPNPAFRGAPPDGTLAFVRDRGFGVLTIAVETAPFAAHAPFVVEEDGATVGLHLVRSNPIVRALRDGVERPALLAVSGPDCYVSPDWYAAGPDQVPTWNYVAAHLRGSLRLLDPERLRPHLAALSAAFEARLAPKPPWRIEKMSEAAFAKLARTIAPAELRVESVEATWKLNQNKPTMARAGAAAGIDAARLGSTGAEGIAALIRADLDDAERSQG